MNPGRILIALMILGGLIGSLAGGPSFYSHMLYLGLLLLFGAWLWTFLLARSFRIERFSDARRGSVGDVFKERFDIFNGSRLPALWLEIKNATPISTTGSRLVTMLRGCQKQSYAVRMWLTRRGSFPLGPTIIVMSDPLGLFRVEKKFEASKIVTVLPMVFPIQTFLSPPGLLPGGQVTRRKSTDITPHASGVREYNSGDPMKRIHWPTSIRRGQLMVKEFDQDPQAEVWLFLDTQYSAQASKPHDETPEVPVEDLLFMRRPKFTLPPSTLEYGITITASLAHYFIQQKRSVGFVAADRAYTTIPAEHNERHENKILETLAFLEGKGNMSIAALVGAQARHLPSGSSVILITPTIRDELLIAVDTIQLRNLHPVVILLNAESFGGRSGNDKLGTQLMERGAPVCLVNCDSDLAKTFSNFSNEHISKDIITWQRPKLSHLI
ncbi:MAG TPA: DUF58 domain-containing protein [Anaerolineales bacterium]